MRRRHQEWWCWWWLRKDWKTRWLLSPPLTVAVDRSEQQQWQQQHLQRQQQKIAIVSLHIKGDGDKVLWCCRRRRLFCCRHILWTCLEQCFLSARPLTRKKRVCCMDTQKMNWIPAKSALSISANLLLSAKEVAKRREKRYTFLPEEYHRHHHHHHHPCVYFWRCRCTLSPNIGVYGNGGAIKRKTHSGKIWSTEEQDSCTTSAAAAC